MQNQFCNLLLFTFRYVKFRHKPRSFSHTDKSCCHRLALFAFGN